jgi:hypothetical protein
VPLVATGTWRTLRYGCLAFQDVDSPSWPSEPMGALAGFGVLPARPLPVGTLAGFERLLTAISLAGREVLGIGTFRGVDADVCHVSAAASAWCECSAAATPSVLAVGAEPHGFSLIWPLGWVSILPATDFCDCLASASSRDDRLSLRAFRCVLGAMPLTPGHCRSPQSTQRRALNVMPARR